MKTNLDKSQVISYRYQAILIKSILEKKYPVDIKYKKDRLTASVPIPTDGKLGSLTASIIYSLNDGEPNLDKITKKVEDYIKAEKKKGNL